MSEKATSPKYAKTPTKTVPLEEIPPPPDGGWGWVVCLASFMCNLILDGIAYRLLFVRSTYHRGQKALFNYFSFFLNSKFSGLTSSL